MPLLDERLRVVAREIRCRRHADIGSDLGHLLMALLASGRIEHGIAIDNKHSPLAQSRANLAGMNAEVRLADGLEGLSVGEVDSLSICGMGAVSMIRILDRHPERWPLRMVLQPNRNAEALRRWALARSLHLVDEQLVGQRVIGQRAFVVLRFVAGTSPDPAYEALDLETAIMFGPHLIRRQDGSLLKRLIAEQRYLAGMTKRSVEMSNRLDKVERLIDSVTVDRSVASRPWER